MDPNLWRIGQSVADTCDGLDAIWMVRMGMGILSLYSVPHVKPLAVTVLRCDNIVQPLPLVMKKASHSINLTHFLFLNLL